MLILLLFMDHLNDDLDDDFNEIKYDFNIYKSYYINDNDFNVLI